MSGFQQFTPEPADGDASEKMVGGGAGGGGGGNGAYSLTSRFIPSADTVKNSALGIFMRAKPWGEFLNTKQFNLPQLSETPDRIKENLQHYAYNYLVVFLVLSLFVVLTRPLSLISVLVLVLGYYWLFVVSGDEPVRVGPVEVDTRLKKAVLLAVFGMILFWVTGAATGIMSLLGTVAVLGGVHAIVRKPASEPDFESGFQA